MYPLKTISRGYIAPIHPIPAIITIVLACAALIGMSFTYGVNILLGILFYSLASVWFIKRRYKFINKSDFFNKGIEKWGMPNI